jgi:hypothetical protein
MSSESPAIRLDVLLILLVAYGAASLLHYGHNAVLLDDYPDMPVWLSRAQIIAAWLGVTTVGVVGWFLIRRRHQLAGLSVLAVYGLLGLDGLGHYAVAPLSAHTFAMNLTIWLEVATALLLLASVSAFLLRQSRAHRVEDRRDCVDGN